MALAGPAHAARQADRGAGGAARDRLRHGWRAHLLRGAAVTVGHAEQPAAVRDQRRQQLSRLHAGRRQAAAQRRRAELPEQSVHGMRRPGNVRGLLQRRAVDRVRSARRHGPPRRRGQAGAGGHHAVAGPARPGAQLHPAPRIDGRNLQDHRCRRSQRDLCDRPAAGRHARHAQGRGAGRGRGLRRGPAAGRGARHGVGPAVAAPAAPGGGHRVPGRPAAAGVRRGRAARGRARHRPGHRNWSGRAGVQPHAGARAGGADPPRGERDAAAPVRRRRQPRASHAASGHPRLRRARPAAPGRFAGGGHARARPRAF